MEAHQDDEFGYVRRDTDVLKRAIQSEGSRTGNEPKEQEAAPPASGGADRAPQRRRTVAPTEPDRSAAQTASKASGLFKRMSSMAGSNQQQPSPKDDELPQSFQVKYLGSRDARGLWGIKHTRRPVDALVAGAKNMPPGVVLPLVKLVVSRDGVAVSPLLAAASAGRVHPIDTISYGVQDLVYTRVFSMIVVRETHQQQQHPHPFECHAFVCESRSSARRLTYALAAAFNEYSKVVKAGGGAAAARKKFAIDLRTPEEIEAELNSALPEVDSEA